MKIKIRRAEEKDKEQLLKLVSKMYKKSSPKTVKQWQLHWKRLIKLTLVAEYQDKIVAYMACGLKPDAFYIGDLYVLPEYRRKRIASELLKTTNKIKKIFKKKYLRVDVRKKDYPAKKFYDESGFKILKEKSPNSWVLLKR